MKPYNSNKDSRSEISGGIKVNKEQFIREEPRIDHYWERYGPISPHERVMKAHVQTARNRYPAGATSQAHAQIRKRINISTPYPRLLHGPGRTRQSSDACLMVIFCGVSRTLQYYLSVLNRLYAAFFGASATLVLNLLLFSIIRDCTKTKSQLKVKFRV